MPRLYTMMTPTHLRTEATDKLAVMGLWPSLTLDLQEQQPEPLPGDVPPPGTPKTPETEKPQPGKEINVPPRDPETERPGTGPEIGPVPDVPESPPPTPDVGVPTPPDMPVRMGAQGSRVSEVGRARLSAEALVSVCRTGRAPGMAAIWYVLPGGRS